MDLNATAGLLGNLGEFISSIVVLVTVIYLAVQVRHTRLSVQSASWQNGVNNIIDWNFRLAEDPELLEIFQRGMADPTVLNSKEQLRLSLVLASFLQQFHTWFLDNEKDLVHEQAWRGEEQSMVQLLSMPGGMHWWRTFGVPYTPKFRTYVDALLEEAQRIGGQQYELNDPLGYKRNPDD